MNQTPEKETNKKKGFFRKHVFDFLLLGVLALGTAAGFVVREVSSGKEGDDLVAKVYLEGELMNIPDRYGNNRNPFDLRLVTSYEEIEIQGRKTSLVIGIDHNAIAVVSSLCPGQECVHVGWVSKPNHPIVCAHNGIYIEVLSSSWDEVIIG
ncbi:MAG: NusG domain II-containing protein [Candidatus Enteromonas sp.]|nr:NusG domain II-containing protein [Candidatus Enteromonas sp.]